MAAYWPSLNAIQNDPVIAGRMNSITKIVISTPLQNPGWNNTKVFAANIKSEMEKLKGSDGNFFIFGRAELCSMLAKNHLIDEFRIMIHPVVLGNGIPLFKEKNGTFNLILSKTRVFKSGNVLLYLRPEN